MLRCRLVQRRPDSSRTGEGHAHWASCDIGVARWEQGHLLAATWRAESPLHGSGHRHNAVVPRMPGVTDFSRFNTMDVALSTCTTKTGLISDWGRTRPLGELRHRCCNSPNGRV